MRRSAKLCRPTSTRSWTTDELLAFDDQHPPTNFEPGTQYQYSNTNTLVLGKLIETLCDNAFSHVLADQTLTPLHLNATAYLSGTKLPPPAVLGYQGDRDETFAILLNASNTPDVLQVLNEAPPPKSGSVCAPGDQGIARRD